MEEQNVKTTFVKNLEKQIFNSTLSLAIDTNVNIQTILNTHTYLYDEKVECANGKAILTARIGIKVLYIDTDGISNTITDSQALSENIIDSSITSDCFINILNHTITSNIISQEGVLKIQCNISLTPVMYLNLPLANKTGEIENAITKKSTFNSIYASNFINTNFNHTSTFETKENLNKILCVNSYFTPTNIKPKNGAVYVEGKLFSTLVFESLENEEIIKKELRDTFNIATEFSVEGVEENSILDLTFVLDKSKEEISTETEDDNTIISVQNTIKVCGVAFKETNLEIVDDIFSTQNEIELNFSEREFIKTTHSHLVNETIFGEIQISENEPAIDEVVSNLNIVPEITNQYAKNNALIVEGVVSSHLNYIDENKNCQHKHIEIPFVLNTKIECENVQNTHTNIHIIDCRVKTKRGTIIEIEYLVEIVVFNCVKEKQSLISNVNIGKPISFAGFDYQIFIAKPNETTWELCKRIKINPEDLNKTNKNLPLIMQGGEKIIIKR